MATSLCLPSELVSAIATTLGNTVGFDVQIGQPDDFEAPDERPWVLIGIERDAPGERPGDPGLSAEGLLRLDETWPDFMRGRWSIKKVTASGKREESYRCLIEAAGLDPKAERTT